MRVFMYQALYRKWRPRNFSDVVGQEHITKTLMNEITLGRHSHAYLFTGSRGTGKTTCAKIFAKAVNCEHPINGDPCNECETCKGIDNGSILDVIEIDAASNNGVDNIRDIRDEANFTPVNGRFRVYIIDEVHMLSGGAFNALLKTLEEPPKHVKFILATTEVHKIPATILSRCQRFDFKRISSSDIAARLQYISSKEEIVLDDEAAMLIARLADGALRDALSILDQCISHSKNITVDVVNSAVGLAGKAHLFELSKYIIQGDGAHALSKINDLHNKSCDMERLCDELINHFRNIMVCRAVNNPEDLVICSDQELSEYKAISAPLEMTNIIEALTILGETKNTLHYGYGKRVEMEMAIVRLVSIWASNSGAQAFVPTVAAAPTASVATAPIAAPAEPVAPTETTPIINEEPEPVPPPMDEEPVPATKEPEPTKEPLEDILVEPITTEFEDSVPVGDPIPDGLIPENIWNALIREVTTMDKPLLGCLPGSKGYKEGNSLKIFTTNFLLQMLVPQPEHNEVIYNATFTVLGTYLRPTIITEDPSTTEESTDKLPEKPEESKVVEEPKTTELSDETVTTEKFEETAQKNIETPILENSEEAVDPLDAFLNKMNAINESEQINLNLFIEE